MRFGTFSCVSVRTEILLISLHIAPATAIRGILVGYPAWIRTKNNASKGRCVTVTPRGIPKGDFRLAILDQTAISKMPTEVAFESRITPKAFGAVTVAPPGMGICDFRLAIFDSSATSKIQVCLRFRKATYGEN